MKLKQEEYVLFDLQDMSNYCKMYGEIAVRLENLFVDLFRVISRMHRSDLRIVLQKMTSWLN